MAVETAREAGAILRTEFDRPKKISYKGEVDIVTESDKRSEAIIVERLQSRFPKHAIIAEEGGGDAEKSRALPLVCRSARRHDEFRARLSRFCRFHRAAR